MNAGLLVCLVCSVVLNLGLGFAVFRLSRRLLEFDDIFQLLEGDIETNIKFFEKLLSTPLFHDSEEVRKANHNMGIISKRLQEFVIRLKEASNRIPPGEQPKEQ